MAKDDGGSAFPVPPRPNGDHEWNVAGGMSLRDYFAATALAGYLSKLPPLKIEATDSVGALPAVRAISVEQGRQIKNGVVGICYEYADAMIIERSK